MAVPSSIKFRVLPYSATALAQALTTSWVTQLEIEAKDHYAYLREYLGSTNGGLNAQTMVVEHPYVSQSYLTDYASYFALGFQSYERFCKRIHFFDAGFGRAQLQAALTTPAGSKVAKRIWDSYLGCVIVKPLPRTPIGATLLKPYQTEDDKVRHYPVRRRYTVNLLGKALHLDTLIFQEQDLVVSACATTALWMAFHKTAELFRTAMPSPYEITAAAKNLFNSSGRTFPNDGLDHYQIGNAIEAAGLVAELLQFDSFEQIQERAEDSIRKLHARGLLLEAVDIADLSEEDIEAEVDFLISERAEEMGLSQMRSYKRIIYAYLRLGLPVLLFIRGDGADSEHLVTVTGYREALQSIRRTEEVSCVAEQLERLYIHDDQLGPFARLGFTEDGRLNTICAAPGSTGPSDQTATLLTIFVPLAADIRLTFQQVFEPVQKFDSLFYERIANRQDVLWDIYLSTGNDYKVDLLSRDWLAPGPRRAAAARLLPKYVWVARAFLGPVPLLELLFDATDLHTGFFCLNLTWFSSDLKQGMTTWLGDADNRHDTIVSGPVPWRYLDMLFASLGLPLTGHATGTRA